VWGQNADRYFPDEEALVKWIDQPSLVPFLHCVADGGKEQFRSWVIGRMIAETRQEDGSCFETFRRINVFAQQ
jgi:trans-aconitate 2-methyltransferase